MEDQDQEQQYQIQDQQQQQQQLSRSRSRSRSRSQNKEKRDYHNSHNYSHNRNHHHNSSRYNNNSYNRNNNNNYNNDSGHKRQIHIANLPLDISEPDIDRVLQQYGDIEEIKIIKSQGNNEPLKHNCFAFVKMKKPEDASNAINNFSGADWKLQYRLTHAEKYNNNGHRGGGGGGYQRGGGGYNNDNRGYNSDRKYNNNRQDNRRSYNNDRNNGQNRGGGGYNNDRNDRRNNYNNNGGSRYNNDDRYNNNKGGNDRYNNNNDRYGGRGDNQQVRGRYNNNNRSSSRYQNDGGNNYRNKGGNQSGYGHNNSHHHHHDNNNSENYQRRRKSSDIQSQQPQQAFDDDEKSDNEAPKQSITALGNDPNSLAKLLSMPSEELNNFIASQQPQNETITEQILVRELYIGNIPQTLEQKQLENVMKTYGKVEEIELRTQTQYPYGFVKFYKVQEATQAFLNSKTIGLLLNTQVKLHFADHLKRTNIVGDHEKYLDDKELQKIIYIGYPYNSTRIPPEDKIRKVCNDYGSVKSINFNKFESTQLKPYYLVELESLSQAKKCFKSLNHKKYKLVDENCEVCILVNSEAIFKDKDQSLFRNQKAIQQQQGFQQPQQQQQQQFQQQQQQQPVQQEQQQQQESDTVQQSNYNSNQYSNQGYQQKGQYNNNNQQYHQNSQYYHQRQNNRYNQQQRYDQNNNGYKNQYYQNNQQQGYRQNNQMGNNNRYRNNKFSNNYNQNYQDQQQQQQQIQGQQQQQQIPNFLENLNPNAITQQKTPQKSEDVLDIFNQIIDRGQPVVTEHKKLSDDIQQKEIDIEQKEDSEMQQEQQQQKDQSQEKEEENNENQQQQQQQQEDYYYDVLEDQDAFWSGFITRSKTQKVGVDIKTINNSVSNEDEVQIQEYHLSVQHRANYEDVFKKQSKLYAVMLPSDEINEKLYQDFAAYFYEKKKAGVIQTVQYFIYLLPKCKYSDQIFQINERKKQLLVVIQEKNAPAVQKNSPQYKILHGEEEQEYRIDMDTEDENANNNNKNEIQQQQQQELQNTTISQNNEQQQQQQQQQQQGGNQHEDEDKNEDLVKMISENPELLNLLNTNN